MRRLLLAGAAVVVAATLVGLASGSSSVSFPPNFTPAQQSQLPGADWFVSAGNLQAQRHSSLTQITPANVSGLKLAFSYPLDGSGYEPLPLIGQESTVMEYGGVLYAMDERGRVYANDATNGNRLWLFEPNNAGLPPNKGSALPGAFAASAGAPTRGLTIGDGMVFVPEPQGVVIALDAKTGHQ